MSPRKIVIDCDPGTDDAIALFLALASPELDVRLVTVVGGNVGLDRTLANARALVGLAGAGIPVIGGADRALLGSFVAEPRVHGQNGLGGVVLPDGPPAAPGVASDAIRALLRQAAPDEITLVGIGPATNLALALATEPALTDRVAEIVLMTGAWSEGNVTPAAEFNAWNDPAALAVVLACGRPVTLATLELTAQALCTPSWLDTLRAHPGGACLRAAHAIMSSVPPSRRLGGKGHPQHDACAVGWLVAPGLFTHRAVHASVDLGPGPCRGRTVIDRWGRLPDPPNARLLETLDPAAFFALLAERIAALP
ncbi:nucleoside hydrolase [Limobrevibacterium gyesilva]|uniref:Nucleoside hydrolase n=1 Tax=Limobrevibacterium gyesilva TaxID=2991712 RepID=A0AA41YS63_9PROT|nr:nucleoside hydrolase [Limobrevibacterium gyesilva]MCW3475613.1 nucleoside hydrolase [Limobrevibacterium gyesilva]